MARDGSRWLMAEEFMDDGLTMEAKHFMVRKGSEQFGTVRKVAGGNVLLVWITLDYSGLLWISLDCSGSPLIEEARVFLSPDVPWRAGL